MKSQKPPSSAPLGHLLPDGEGKDSPHPPCRAPSPSGRREKNPTKSSILPIEEDITTKPSLLPMGEGGRRPDEGVRQGVSLVPTAQVYSNTGAWKRYLISDLCEIKYGKALKSEDRIVGEYPVYGSNGLVGYHNVACVKKESILIGRKGSIGEVHYSSTPFWPIDTTYYLEYDSDKIYVRWFYRLLKTLNLKQLNRSAAIPGLNRDDVYRIKVLVPPLNDQIRIAAVLTRAEALIATRKESIKALDELLKSTFLEMFGFNGTDYKKWEIEPLNTNTEIVSGVTKGKKYNSSILRTVPYMRVANVQDGHLNLTEIKTIEVTEAEINQYKLRKGDLLLTEGGDPDKLGRGAVWNDEIDECIHQNHIFRVRVKNTSINPTYLSALIASKYGKSYFLKAAKQTTGIASINSTQLKAFPFVKPPLPLQNQFAAIVEKVEALKATYTKNLAELENLYGSLSQRAFKGELDVSGVVLESQNQPPSIPPY